MKWSKKFWSDKETNLTICETTNNEKICEYQTEKVWKNSNLVKKQTWHYIKRVLMRKNVNIVQKRSRNYAKIIWTREWNDPE